MRAVVQRVLRASVTVVPADGAAPHEVASIQAGLLILLGVHTSDTPASAEWLAAKIANLRIFEDDDGRLNRSLLDCSLAALVVSNFTLYGDCRKGRRPGFSEAASGEAADGLYREFGARLAAHGAPVQYGVFGAEMRVELVNDGPVTLVIDT